MKKRSFILTEYTRITTKRFCEKDIVNAILNLKYQTAIQEGIDCFFHIDIDGMCGIDDISLCSIFANTLDNAIEACRQLPGDASRKISAKARFAQNRYFSYEITNTKQNAVQERNGRFLTGKSDKKMHGLGLSSVQEAVEKYSGSFHVSYTDTEFCIVILIEL